MKKVFSIFLLIPFFAFATIDSSNFDDFIVNSNFTVRAYRYNSSGGFTYSSFSAPFSLIVSRMLSMQLGFELSNTESLFCSFFVGSSAFQSSATASNLYFIQASDGRYYTIGLIPQLSNITRVLAFHIKENPHLYSTTYVSGSRQFYNVYPYDIMANIISSTNDTFKLNLFTALNQISLSLNGVSSNLQNIYNTLQDLNSSSQYNYSTVSNRFVNLVPTFQGSGIDARYNQVLSDLNPSNYDSNDSQSMADFDARVNSYGRALDFLSALSGLGNMLTPSDPGSNNGLGQLGDLLNQSLNNNVSTLGGSAASLNTNLTNYTRLSTNWQESVKKDLQDWRNDVTNRLSHMFDDGVGVKGGNNTSPVVVSGAYGGPVGVAGTVHAVIDNLTLGVQIDKPVQIDHTQLNQIAAGYDSIVDAVQSFHDSFTDFTTSGNKPFNWIAYYNMFYDFSNSVQSNHVDQISLLSSLTNLMFNYTQNFTNDLIFSISNALVGLSAVSNDYMLLTDYANYINSSGLSDLIDIMDDDTYSDLKDELLGISSLDQADSYGRWWRYFTGLVTVSANSSLKISNLLSGHEKTIHDLSEEPGAKSLLDHFSDLLESIPSQTDIDDKSNQLTNSIDSTGFSALLVDIDTMSNSFNNVSRFFDRGSTLPQSITLDLGLGSPSASANPNPIVLPLSKYRGIMDLLHYGIAFSYCVVNLILLPKFILLLIHLFDKVWRGYDKKLAHSTTV